MRQNDQSSFCASSRLGERVLLACNAISMRCRGSGEMFDTSSRLAGMIVILLTVVLVAAFQQPEWAHDLGLEEKTWTDLMGILSDAGEVPATPSLNEKVIVERNAKKVQVTEAVIAGRLTLFEAASEFRCLNEDLFPAALAIFTADHSQEERLCLSVIQWVRSHPKEQHSDAVDEVCAHLEEQLRQHKEQHGRVILPEVAASER
jgi:hypothetical protein